MCRECAEGAEAEHSIHIPYLLSISKQISGVNHYYETLRHL